MLQRGIQLELPATETATEIDEARIVVSLDRDSRIRINDRPVQADLLLEQMRRLAATRPSETVFLQADKLLPYGEVLLVMDQIRKAGVTRVALVTVPLERVEGS
jgi:biopolymer transport protein ExbD